MKKIDKMCRAGASLDIWTQCAFHFDENDDDMIMRVNYIGVDSFPLTITRDQFTAFAGEPETFLDYALPEVI